MGCVKSRIKMYNIADKNFPDNLFTALSEQLAIRDQSFELVVIGGSALLVLGLIDRVTKDIDVLGIYSKGEIAKANPLPTELANARDLVSRDFQIPKFWLNGGPADLCDFGLPSGFSDRLIKKNYGKALTVFFAARFDQIHFKLYALVDQGPGKHETDLLALQPTKEELLAAARWTITHDPSPGFYGELKNVLRYLGVENADFSI